jgi:hypothetical protein
LNDTLARIVIVALCGGDGAASAVAAAASTPVPIKMALQACRDVNERIGDLSAPPSNGASTYLGSDLHPTRRIAARSKLSAGVDAVKSSSLAALHPVPLTLSARCRTHDLDRSDQLVRNRPRR